MKYVCRTVLISIAILSCEGPEGDIGPSGLKSLIKIEAEPVGQNCVSGGLRIKSGIDKNDNNILEDDEIQVTDFLCNGVNGAQGPIGVDGMKSLIKTEIEPKGANCTNGGLLIKLGVDTNKDGVLNDNEVQTTQFVCNGINAEGVNIIRVPIQVAFTWRQAETIWGSENKDQLIYKFNILDYPGFTKAFFVAQFDRSPDNTTDSLYLRLYDYKNQKKIENSEVWSTITNADFNADPNKRVFQSVDIYNSFEKKESTIGIQLRKQLNVADYRGISIHGAEILLMK